MLTYRAALFIVAYKPVSSALQANRPAFRVNAVFIHSSWTQRECVWDSSKSATGMFLDNGRCSVYVARCLRTYVVFCTRPRVIITSRQTSKFACVKMPKRNVSLHSVTGNAPQLFASFYWIVRNPLSVFPSIFLI